MHLRTLFWNYMDDTWVSHIALSLVENMRGEGLDISLVSHASDPPGRREFTEDGVPPAFRGLVYRVDRGQRLVRALTRRRFLRGLANADAVYLWPSVPLDLFQQVRALGLPIVLERVNTHRIEQRRVLNREFAAVGLDPEAHGVSRELLAIEQKKLALTDWVCSPSPHVTASMVEGGFRREKIIETSYGWSPTRMQVRQPRRADGPFTVLFCGSLCIRKGVHRLLRAWAASGVEGRLQLMGGMADLQSVPGIEALLRRSDVELLGHVTDVAPIYANADVFAFASFEEGSPLVVYEAMAHGLPVLASPMGAGAIVRPDVDGWVREPDDFDGWVEALRRLAADAPLRQRLGAAARQRVQEFTWHEVGRRRRRALLERLAGVPAANSAVAP